jgi:amino acid transporter
MDEHNTEPFAKRIVAGMLAVIFVIVTVSFFVSVFNDWVPMLLSGNTPSEHGLALLGLFLLLGLFGIVLAVATLALTGQALGINLLPRAKGKALPAQGEPQTRELPEDE